MVKNNTIIGPEVIKEYGIEFWGSGCNDLFLKIGEEPPIKFNSNIIFEINLVYGKFIIIQESIWITRYI